jgi:hypothetical protein
LGRRLRDSGQKRVPLPPARINARKPWSPRKARRSASLLSSRREYIGPLSHLG